MNACVQWTTDEMGKARFREFTHGVTYGLGKWDGWGDGHRS